MIPIVYDDLAETPHVGTTSWGSVLLRGLRFDNNPKRYLGITGSSYWSGRASNNVTSRIVVI